LPITSPPFGEMAWTNSVVACYARDQPESFGLTFRGSG
jgi:hypothetical protein